MNECTGCFDPNCGSDKPLIVKSTVGRTGRLVDVKVILMSDLRTEEDGERGYQTLIEYIVTYHERHIPRVGSFIWVGDDDRYEVGSITSGIYPDKDTPGIADGYLEIHAFRDEP